MKNTQKTTKATKVTNFVCRFRGCKIIFISNNSRVNHENLTHYLAR